MFVYNIGIQPENRNKYKYGKIKNVEFSCPVHCKDSVEIDGIESEVYAVLHEAGGESWLYVKWDRYKIL